MRIQTDKILFIFILFVLTVSCNNTKNDKVIKPLDSLQTKAISKDKTKYNKYSDTNPAPNDTFNIDKSIREKVVYFKITSSDDFTNGRPPKVIFYKYSNDTLTLKLHQIISGHCLDNTDYWLENIIIKNKSVNIIISDRNAVKTYKKKGEPIKAPQHVDCLNYYIQLSGIKTKPTIIKLNSEVFEFMEN